jgi:hypothetical protein
MLSILAAFLISTSAATAAAGDLSELAGLRLRDQYGVEDSLASHRGRVVVVMVVDAERLRALKAWERDLRERVEGFEVLRIAEVPLEPPTSYARVSAKLAEQVPEGVSVLIDLERQWAATLGLDASRPTLLLVDREGRLAATAAGRHEPALAAEVAARLAALMGAP